MSMLCVPVILPFCLAYLIFKSSNLQIFKSSNLQIFKSSNLQIFKSSNLQIFKSSNLQIFKSSNLQIFKSSNLQIFKSSNVILLLIFQFGLLSCSNRSAFSYLPNQGFQVKQNSVVYDSGSVFNATTEAGSLGVTTQFTIKNTGQADIHFSSLVQISGDTEITISTNVSRTLLAASQTLTFDISYVPTQTGRHNSTISLQSNVRGQENYTFLFQGTATEFICNHETGFFNPSHGGYDFTYNLLGAAERGCLTMKQFDDASCRSPGFSECVDISAALVTCKDGWRLPNNFEIQEMSKFATSARNFCNYDSGNCSPGAIERPFYYVSSFISTTSELSIASGLEKGEYKYPLNLRNKTFSVRCIRAF